MTTRFNIDRTGWTWLTKNTKKIEHFILFVRNRPCWIFFEVDWGKKVNQHGLKLLFFTPCLLLWLITLVSGVTKVKLSRMWTQYKHEQWVIFYKAIFFRNEVNITRPGPNTVLFARLFTKDDTSETTVQDLFLYF